MKISSVRVGFVILLIGMVSAACFGAVSLSEESMATLHGGTPGGSDGWVCGGDNPCQEPGGCQGYLSPCVRCTSGDSAQGCQQALLGGKPYCDQGWQTGGCGQAIPGATCRTALGGGYSCQGGDEQNASGVCDRWACNAHN